MSNQTNTEQSGLGVLSSGQYLIVLHFFGILEPFLGAVGIVTNSINIHVFFKMGIVDGVTLSFQVLSFSDLGSVISRFMLGMTSCMEVLEQKNIIRFYLKPLVVKIFVANIGLMMCLLSTLVTTFLAIARCMCIVKPLHFKNTFSKKRSSVVLAVFTFYSVVCFVPIFSTTGTKETFDNVRNSSRSRGIHWTSESRHVIRTIITTMANSIIPVVTQIIIIVCIFVMAKALRRARQFRQSISAKLKTPSEAFSGDQSDHAKAKPDPNDSKLSGKELQVIQQIALICTMFIFTNIPKIFTAVYTVMEPEFAINKRYHYIHLTCNNVKACTEIINASLNLFVYLKYNSRFRQMCFAPNISHKRAFGLWSG